MTQTVDWRGERMSPGTQRRWLGRAAAAVVLVAVSVFLVAAIGGRDGAAWQVVLVQNAERVTRLRSIRPAGPLLIRCSFKEGVVNGQDIWAAVEHVEQPVVLWIETVQTRRSPLPEYSRWLTERVNRPPVDGSSGGDRVVVVGDQAELERRLGGTLRVSLLNGSPSPLLGERGSGGEGMSAAIELTDRRPQDPSPPDPLSPKRGEGGEEFKNLLTPSLALAAAMKQAGIDTNGSDQADITDAKGGFQSSEARASWIAALPKMPPWSEVVWTRRVLALSLPQRLADDLIDAGMLIDRLILEIDDKARGDRFDVASQMVLDAVRGLESPVRADAAAWARNSAAEGLRQLREIDVEVDSWRRAKAWKQTAGERIDDCLDAAVHARRPENDPVVRWLGAIEQVQPTSVPGGPFAGPRGDILAQLDGLESSFACGVSSVDVRSSTLVRLRRLELLAKLFDDADVGRRVATLREGVQRGNGADRGRLIEVAAMGRAVQGMTGRRPIPHWDFAGMAGRLAQRCVADADGATPREIDVLKQSKACCDKLISALGRVPSAVELESPAVQTSVLGSLARRGRATLRINPPPGISRGRWEVRFDSRVFDVAGTAEASGPLRVVPITVPASIDLKWRRDSPALQRAAVDVVYRQISTTRRWSVPLSLPPPPSVASRWQDSTGNRRPPGSLPVPADQTVAAALQLRSIQNAAATVSGRVLGWDTAIDPPPPMSTEDTKVWLDGQNAPAVLGLIPPTPIEGRWSAVRLMPAPPVASSDLKTIAVQWIDAATGVNQFEFWTPNVVSVAIDNGNGDGQRVSVRILELASQPILVAGGTATVDATVAVAIPRDSFDVGRDVVTLGLDLNGDRRLRDEPVVTSATSATTRTVAGPVDAAGRLPLTGSIEPLRLSVPISGLSDRRTSLLASVTLGGEVFWSRPVEVVLDRAGPTVRLGGVDPRGPLAIGEPLIVRGRVDDVGGSGAASAEAIWVPDHLSTWPPDAKPIAGANDDSGQWVWTLPTEKLSAGRWRVLARATDRAGNVGPVASIVVDVQTAEAVAEQSAGQTTLVGGTVAYVGEAVSGLGASLHRVDGDQVSVEPLDRQTTNAGGRFQFTSVVAGKYQIIVEGLHRGEIRRRSVAVDVHPPQPVTVPVIRID